MPRATRRFSIVSKKQKRRPPCGKALSRSNVAKGFHGPTPRRSSLRSMDFDVEISPRAFRDLDEPAAELRERSQSYTVARRWFLAVVDAIDSLAQMSERCPVVTEAH